MKLVVGLGNIGEKYEKTRHNAGFVVVDRLVGQLDSSGWIISNKAKAMLSQTKVLIVAKPITYMNDSGLAVAYLTNFYKIKHEDIYVVYDDLDIALGEYKIQFDKGPKVHNGLTSVREKLGTNAFWHVRVGVENREVKGNTVVPGVEYSLQNFAPGERVIFEEVVEKINIELVNIL